MLQIDVRIDGDEAVVTLSGRLTGSESPKLLREKVDALLREGYRKFVLDLASMSYADSGGLGEIVQIYRTVQRKGAVLQLRARNNPVADLLRISKLLTVFEGDPSEHIPDQTNPRMQDDRWQLAAGVALMILVIIAVMFLLR